jgi:hypothetical protein
LLDERIDADFIVCIQSVEISFQPSPRTLNGNVLDRQDLISNFGYYAPGEMDLDRRRHSTAAKSGDRLAAA